MKNAPETHVAPTLELKSLSRCPLCQGAKRRRLYGLAQSAVYRCQICGLAYLDPCLDSGAMAKAYESSQSLKQLHDFHEGYYEYGSLDKDSKTLREFTQSLEMAEGRLPAESSKKLFEVGFGNGLFLALAQKRGWRVDGIDTSPMNVRVAHERFKLNLRQGFFESLADDGHRWDAVAMMDVIEHTDQPYALLAKAYGLLKPGGILLLGTPNEGSFFRALSNALWKLSAGVMRSGIDKIYFLEHVAYYDRGTLAELLRRAGFEPLKSFYAETDLEKYRLRPLERLIGKAILFCGKLLRRENRLIMCARKQDQA